MLIAFLALGGTSLINANVFLEADEDTLRLEPWPQEIRDDPKSLDQCMLSQDSPLCS